MDTSPLKRFDDPSLQNSAKGGNVTSSTDVYTGFETLPRAS
jgi:hypothetical protein